MSLAQQLQKPKPAFARLVAQRLPLVTRLALLSVFGLVLIRTAWMSDDAYITLRVVDNFVNGYGPVWNTDERVQAYTHPLWMLLLTAFYAITREEYLTTLAISIVLSLSAVGLVLWQADTRLRSALFLGAVLISSKAFVDYSTSGLENPLTHLLIAVFAILLLRQRAEPQPSQVYALALVGGIMMLNRLDTGLLVIPSVLVQSMRLSGWVPRMRALGLLFGLPLSWMAFSTFYYGFPLPNTYYAKQAAGIPREQFLERGVAYVVDVVQHDPLTPAVMLVGVLSAILSKERRWLLPLAAGVLLYAAYTVWVGGDFMRGRFFSASVMIGALCFTWGMPQVGAVSRVAPPLAAVIASALGLLAQPVPNVLSDETYPRPPQIVHIIDERGWYYWRYGLLVRAPSLLSGKPQPRAGTRPRRIQVAGAIGRLGFTTGPSGKIIDKLGLADAFLARLPYIGDKSWRIGHIDRVVPAGYVRTRVYGHNYIENEPLRRLYDKLQLVTQGPLWHPDRWRAIAELNLSPSLISASQFMDSPQDLITHQFQRGLYAVSPKTGLSVFTVQDKRSLPAQIALVTDAESKFELRLYQGEVFVREYELPSQVDRSGAELRLHLIDIRSRDGEVFDFIHLVPTEPGSNPRAGWFRVFDEVPPKTSNAALLRHGIVLSAALSLSIPSKPYTWVEGKQMFGLGWLERQGTARLTLSLFPFCKPAEGQVVSVLVNDLPIAEHTWLPEQCDKYWETEIFIPQEKLKRGWNVIELRARHAQQPKSIYPDNPDSRFLSVAVRRLEFRPNP